MRVKINSKSQIRLPDAVVRSIGGSKLFDVGVIAGQIVLTPAQPSKTDLLRDHLNSRGLTRRDIADAVAWARRG